MSCCISDPPFFLNMQDILFKLLDNLHLHDYKVYFGLPMNIFSKPSCSLNLVVFFRRRQHFSVCEAAKTSVCTSQLIMFDYVQTYSTITSFHLRQHLSGCTSAAARG